MTVKHKGADVPNAASAGDYFEVLTRDDVFYVSREMVMCIEAALHGWWPRRWVTFVDIVGARVRVRARTIQSIRQSSAPQRAEYRRLQRAWRTEAGADCDWEE